jgi:hypothetical protein
MVFWSVEENEEAMRRMGVDQRIRQLGRGAFRCDMAVSETEEAVLFCDRFSKAFSMVLEAPQDRFGVR